MNIKNIIDKINLYKHLQKYTRDGLYSSEYSSYEFCQCDCFAGQCGCNSVCTCQAQCTCNVICTCNKVCTCEFGG